MLPNQLKDTVANHAASAGGMPIPAKPLALALLLAVLTALLYWPVQRHQFINYDDPDYVTGNPVVQAGLTASGIAWAFQAEHAQNWHPITWLSHMLDCQLFGLNPGGHHLVNLGLHVGSSVMLLLVLYRMTRALWRSALVATLFAWHPLHVESVAWIAERKDVLSAFLFMLTLWTYARYAQCGVRSGECGMVKASTLQAPRSRVPRPLFYALSLAFFALGLMSKPMVVTLPFVLLLLDYWPLQRIAECGVRNAECGEQRSGSFASLLVEKLPFLALALAASLLTLRAQHLGGAVTSFEQLPLGARVANAITSYVLYLGKLVWPTRLAIFYPQTPIPGWQVISSALLLAILTLSCVALAKRRPYSPVGWFWYCGMLLPVIGLVQVGWQAMADRYSYLPSIGVFLMFAWGLAEPYPRSAASNVAKALGAALLLLGCAAGTRLQLAHWQDSRALFEHALAVNPQNWLAHNNLGTVLAEEGQLEEAGKHFRTALLLKPTYDDACSNLGRYLAERGQLDEARSQLEGLVQRNPRHARAHRNLGYVLLAQGSISQGAAQYGLAQRLQLTDAATPADLVTSLSRLQQSPGSEAAVRDALSLLPTADLQADLANTWAGQGKFRFAAEAYRAALARQPESTGLLNNLAWMLATCPDPTVRNGTEAVRLAEKACTVTQYQRPMLVGTLAAAYAEVGRLAEAVATAEKAAALATAAGDEALARRNRELLEQYRAGQPHHEPVQP